ncbi:hypothetical protein [Acutalibacter muris]|jgi:hypothetical protein|uniref:hypothetical protein n=1 Tax=Acutalibacter muris TaxID=1796620 RepID=UPI00272E1EE2|nr:hypothetical protein [Acutalibacter muris]
MKKLKRIADITIVLFISIFLLVSCSSTPDIELVPDHSKPATASSSAGAASSIPGGSINQSEPDTSEFEIDSSKEPPLQDADWAIAVPDFLTEEQQLFYRRAYSLYRHMFGGDTSWIDYLETLDLDNTPIYYDEKIRTAQYTYTKSQGRYQLWSEFDSVVHSVFTEDFFAKCNKLDDENKIYMEHNGLLYFIDLGRGSGNYYNENFADNFILVSRTDSEILFTLVGHYSDVFPRDGETIEEYEERRKHEFDYTLEFPMKMILTEDGWRFDEFHSASADEEAEQ